MTAENAVTLTQYLTFFVAGEEYAVGVLRVKEIIEYQPLTRVPSTPPWVRGVINLRGAVVPVVDLGVKFGLPASTVTKRTCLVIVELAHEGERAVLGIVVDTVSQVMDLSAADIEPAPPFGTQVRVDYLLGMAKLDKKFVLLLDIDRVLSAREVLAPPDVLESDPTGEAVEPPPVRKRQRRQGSVSRSAAKE
jgi:purine-binding chemotaxis protein CheW